MAMMAKDVNDEHIPFLHSCSPSFGKYVLCHSSPLFISLSLSLFLDHPPCLALSVRPSLPLSLSLSLSLSASSSLSSLSFFALPLLLSYPFSLLNPPDPALY
jgi:hypothetical protein